MEEKETNAKDFAQKESLATPYDDVFRTLLTDCRKLAIPLINEIFGKHYSFGENITLRQNEVYILEADGKQNKRITDSNLLLGKETYHLECQATPDGSILLRLFEYDSQIALSDAVLTHGKLEVSFPRTAVLYLRHPKKTPETMEIILKVPGDSCRYEIPILKIDNYSMEEIFEKKLYFLLPFHIFSYEKHFPELEKEKEQISGLQQQYGEIIKRMEELVQAGILTEYDRHTILAMAKKVLENIARNYENVKKGVSIIMGGEILEYEAKTILRQGIRIGQEEGIRIGQEEGIRIGQEEGIRIGQEEGFALAVKISQYLKQHPDVSSKQVAELFSCTVKEIEKVKSIL